MRKILTLLLILILSTTAFAQLEKIDGQNRYEYIATPNDVPCRITIGGTKEEEFVPAVRMLKWSGEYVFNVEYPVTISAQRESFIDDKVELAVGDNTHRFYFKEDGRLEYEIELSEKPPNNRIELSLSFSEALGFYHQDTLENQYREDPVPGMTLEEFLRAAHQPEDVINSYALYVNKANNQYQTGKFGHIFRSSVTDSNDVSVWCTQSITKLTPTTGIWTIIIPDNVVYPTTLGPTLGYTTAGGSTLGSNTTINGPIATTDGSGGNINSFHCAIAAVHGSDNNYKMGVYDTDQSGQIQIGDDCLEQVEYSAVVVSDDNEVAALGTTNLVASTEYCIVGIPEHGDTTTKYDSLADAANYDTGTTFGEECYDPSDVTYTQGTWRFSIWVVYGEAAAGAGQVIIINVN